MPGDSPHWSHWSDEDVERLLHLIEGGSSLHDLARALGRSESDLEEETRFLSVMVPQHEAMTVSTRTVDSSARTATVHYAPSNSGDRLT